MAVTSTPAAATTEGWADERLAVALGSRREELVALWEGLAATGPTFGETIDPDPEAVRRGFLRPLARMLAAAAGGSRLHRACYLDGRLAYLPKALPGTERADTFARLLGVEAETIADLLADACPSKTTVGALAALHSPLVRIPESGDPRLLMVGDCVFNDVRVFLSENFASRTGRALDADHIYFSAGISPLKPDDVHRAIETAPPSLIGLSLFSYNGIPAYTALIAGAAKLGDTALGDRVEALVAMLASSIDAIREVSDATILVHTASSLPITPRRLRLRFVPAQARGRRRLNAAITARVGELVGATENTLLLDEERLIASSGGLRRVGAPVLGADYEGAYAHPSHFGPVLAAEYADVLASHQLLGKAKALLVDFDNTLWHGVMGDGPVTHHPERQRLLRRLKEAGVLLIALSKNDPKSIRWNELELEPEDFVLQMVNWRPKPDNVSAAIAALDLAPDAFVLLDDNPVERALVEENVAGVRSLDPSDPTAWTALARWLDFSSTKQTEEARRRTELYREAAERREVMGGEHDYEQMMRSLDLRAEVRLAKPDDLPRLLELIQRTNQFNTTTRRRSAAEVTELLESDSDHVFAASLGDRFGDLGVVAVVIAREQADAGVEIDSFIMSCRAMGFGLEQLVVAEVITTLGAPRYSAPFVPTDRNGPAASLYPSSGFTEIEPGRWSLDDPSTGPVTPAWFVGGRPG